MIQRMYPIQKASRTEFVPIRHLNYHVRQWGTPHHERTPLVMVHGWMDVSASFQFVIDALQHDHWVIAPVGQALAQAGAWLTATRSEHSEHL